eukprot:3839300-Amphidinium_carterae.1
MSKAEKKTMHTNTGNRATSKNTLGATEDSQSCWMKRSAQEMEKTCAAASRLRQQQQQQTKWTFNFSS